MAVRHTDDAAGGTLALGWPRGTPTVQLEARLSATRNHSSEHAHRIWIYIIKEADVHVQVQIRMRITNLAAQNIEAIKKGTSEA